MAEEVKPGVVNEGQEVEIERFKKRLDMLDQRLDNIDSVVTAAVERIMSQPLAVNVTCPYCGKNIEITLIGNYKPK